MTDSQQGKEPVLILGAASDIARALARAYAAEGHPLYLAARNPDRLTADAEDLRIRWGIPVEVHPFDVLDTAGHSAFLDALTPPPDIVACVVGLLGDHNRSINDAAAAELVMRTNYIGPALVLEAAARRMERVKRGTIIGISSVAGDRGRRSNYVYGSAKAGLTAYLSGLRARLHESGVRVITVKPGFVDTRMTEGMPLPKPLTAQPEEVARAVVAAGRRKRDVIYVRPIWRPIMTIIRHLPEPLFKRVKF
jgi:decaprenylphospho-beta-D-erythro-pentofuranosid-2-ulose 2-reductase